MCVGPTGGGCTKQPPATSAPYGTEGRDGGKLCRACYGRKYQRVRPKELAELTTPPQSSARVEHLHAMGRTLSLPLESIQDREATIKTLLQVLGCRCFAPCLVAFAALPTPHVRACPHRLTARPLAHPQELRPGPLSRPGGPSGSPEPIEDEIDEQYLVYGLFERADRPDGAFLSKRWCSLEHLLEHTPPGNLLNKISEWEAGRAARATHAIASVLEAAEAEAEAEEKPRPPRPPRPSEAQSLQADCRVAEAGERERRMGAAEGGFLHAGTFRLPRCGQKGCS